MSALRFGKKKVHTLIVSDFHFKKKWRFLFWTEGSNPKALLKILRRYEFQRLIINGDIFHDLDVPLNSDEQRAITFLQNYNLPGSSVELIVLLGNHDPLGKDHPLKQNIQAEYCFTHQGKDYLVTHGDEFDESLNNKLGMFIIDWAEWFARLIGVYMFVKKYFNLGIWDKINQSVTHKALLYASKKKKHYAFIGHTHMYGFSQYEDTICGNSGCLNDWEPTVIVIPVEDHTPEIHKFSQTGEFQEAFNPVH